MKKRNTAKEKVTPDDIQRHVQNFMREIPEEADQLSSSEISALLQEMRIYQTELEIQNEELRRMQIELTESRNKYYDLYNFAPLGYFTLDEKNCIFDLNLTGAGMLGRPRQYLLNSTFFQFICQPDNESFYEHLQEARAMGKNSCELSMRDANGVQFYARLEIKMVGDNPAHTYVIMSNISESKRAEIALRKSEEQFRTSIETVFAPFAMLQAVRDENGGIIDFVYEYANMAGCDAYGVVRTKLVGAKLLELFPQYRDTGLFTKFQEVVRSCQPWIDSSFAFLSSDNAGKVAAFISISVAKWQDGIVMTWQDVTERQTWEDQREDLLQNARTERDRAEDLARAVGWKRDLLNTIMENTETQLVYLDPEFNFVRVNSAYCRGCGHSAEALLGRNHFDLFPDEENLEIFRKVRDTGQAVSFRARPFVYHDQPERGVTYWDWTLVPVKYKDGSLQGLVFSLTDVTEQQFIEQALRDSEERFRRIFESNLIGIVFWTVEGGIKDCNDAFLEMIGYSRQELENDVLKWTELTVPEYADQDKEFLQKLLSGDPVHPIEKEFFHKNGDRVPVLMGGILLSGSADSGVSFVLDISDRKRMEMELRRSRDELEIRVQERTRELTIANQTLREEIKRRQKVEKSLRASEQRFRLLVNSMVDTVFTLDSHFRFVEVFGEQLEKFGVSKAELFGKKIQDIKAFGNPDIHVQAFHRTLENEPVIYEWSADFAGATIYYQNVLAPIFTPDGKIDGIVGVARDITLSKFYEARLIQAEKLATVGEMAALISHRFRNSLTSIRMILELLGEGKNIRKYQAGSIQVALESIGQMEMVVKQLLNFSRPEEAKYQLAALNDLIRGTIDFLRMRLEKEQISIYVRLASALPLMKLDVPNFREVLINLILNSIQAIKSNENSGQQPRISVFTRKVKLRETLKDLRLPGSARKDVMNTSSAGQDIVLERGTSCVILEIRDTGCGIEPDNVDRIFDLFYTTKKGGSGLGLPMVKRTVNAHGGTVRIQSVPGQGTRVNIYLPISGEK